MSDPTQDAKSLYAQLTGDLVSTGVKLHRAVQMATSLAQHHTDSVDQLEAAARLRPSALTDEYLDQRTRARQAQALSGAR